MICRHAEVYSDGTCVACSKQGEARATRAIDELRSIVRNLVIQAGRVVQEGKHHNVQGSLLVTLCGLEYLTGPASAAVYAIEHLAAKADGEKTNG